MSVKERRMLSKLAGKIDSSMRRTFCGVFTEETIPLADNLSDLNKPNLFIIQLDGYFIVVFNTSEKCYLIDGQKIKTYSVQVASFLENLARGNSVMSLPFPLLHGGHSLKLCLLFGAGLSENLSPLRIIKKFNFKPNNYLENSEIINAWFTTRYGLQ